MTNIKKEGSIILGIAGGTASGKTTLARVLQDCAGKENCEVISLDSYYRDGSHLSIEERALQNYDHPDIFEFSLLAEHLSLIKNLQKVEIPQYDFSTHTRKLESVEVAPKKLIIVEGILTLVQQSLREKFDFSVFVDAEDDLRYQRRLRRDVAERGRTEESVLVQWKDSVQPSYKEFCLPSTQYADKRIVGIGDFNEVASDILAELKFS